MLKIVKNIWAEKEKEIEEKIKNNLYELQDTVVDGYEKLLKIFLDYTDLEIIDIELTGAYTGTITFNLKDKNKKYELSHYFGSCDFCDAYLMCSDTTDYKNLLLNMIQKLKVKEG